MSEIASRVGMKEGAVSKAVFDLRRHFAEEIRREIQETVTDEESVEEELRYLVRLLRK